MTPASLQRYPAGTIRGTVFDDGDSDGDSDGAFDSGEPSLGGRTVNLAACATSRRSPISHLKWPSPAAPATPTASCSSGPTGPSGTWLQVAVLPTATTRLTSASVFYFGNLVGDTGDAPVSGRATVNMLDMMRARAASLGRRAR